MTDPSSAMPVAKVVRYELAKVRTGQSLIPVAFFASLVARYIPNAITLVLAGAVYLATIVAFVRARRGFGRHPLFIVRGKIHFGVDGDEIWPSRVTTWTLEGSLARLYGSEFAWKLRGARGEEQKLLTTLKSVLGKPVGRHRKGSLRARMLSLGGFIAGVICVVVGFRQEILSLTLVGTAGVLFGMTAFLTLSQKIVGSRSMPD